jgi:enamine deaminase RidA (YjgF/YER057c/UK114 family)
VKRINLSSGAPWEPEVGYSRAVRVGDRIVVTGTTATLPGGGHAGEGDAGAQAQQIFKNIEAALAGLGGGLRDVLRTRIYVLDIERDWEAVGRAHKEALGETMPATSMIEVSRFIAPWMLVEIEAEAVVGVTGVEARAL